MSEEELRAVELTVAPEHAGLRVDAFLAGQLPWRSRRGLADLVAQGRVRLGGRAIKKSQRVTAGDVVALLVPAIDSEAELAELRIPILYEDDELIAIDKPAGLAVHAAAACPHVHAQAWLRRHLGDADPSVVHRLDRTTSGVVVFTKRRELVAFYTRQFEQRTVAKRYLALVHGSPEPPQGRIEHALATPDAEPVRTDPSGKPSRTDYRVLEPGPRSLVEARPHTGRKHQIRVHLAAIGHPLVGDHTYGAPADDPPGAHLHAAALALSHRDGRRLELAAPAPAWVRPRSAAAP